MATPNRRGSSRSSSAAVAARRDVAAEVRAGQEARRALARVWLLGAGYLELEAAGEYVVTEAGRDFMLWALWEAAGSPGVPASAFEEEAPS